MGYQPSARASTVVQGLFTGMRGLGTTENSALLAQIAKKRINQEEIRTMNNSLTSQSEETALRIDESNLNHHLWNNNGTWWIHYTIYPTPVTVERVRRSLKTKNLNEARVLRDKILIQIINCEEKLAA